jgi:hypothetical protein
MMGRAYLTEFPAPIRAVEDTAADGIATLLLL